MQGSVSCHCWTTEIEDRESEETTPEMDRMLQPKYLGAIVVEFVER